MSLTASTFFLTPPGQISRSAEDAFFSGIRTRNRVSKQTATGRLGTIDKAVVRRLTRAKAELRTLLDVGVSSGVTTVEFSDALAAAGFRPDVTATDRWLYAYLVPVLRRGCALLGEDGEVLQLELLGRAIRPWRRRLDYVTGMALLRLAAEAWMGRRARRMLRADAPGIVRVELVTPRLKARPFIALVQDDVLVRNPAFVGRFDFVRAANILNRKYFDEPSLLQGLANLRAYLAGPGSWLLVNRTHPDGKQRGTLFRLGDDGKLEAVERFGGGSEIEPLVAQLADGGRA